MVSSCTAISQTSMSDSTMSMITLSSPERLAIAQTLPYDVIGEILKQFSAPFMIDIENVNFPFHLGHICSSWRDVFLSLRSYFWSKFILKHPPVSQDQVTDTKRVIALAKMFLDKGKPFSIDIDYHFISRSFNILEMFVAESPRWETAIVSLTTPHIPMLLGVKNRLPLLSSLTLLVGGHTSRFATAVPQGYEDIFQDAPCLTEIRLYSLQNWRFNWLSLTSLHLDGEDESDSLLRALPQMTNLQDLHVAGNVGYPLPPDQAIVNLLRLKTLVISSVSLLCVLQTPCLEHLSLEKAHHLESRGGPLGSPSQPSFHICDDFFQRSLCRLRHLGLGSCKIDVIERLLYHTPELSSLEMFECWEPCERYFDLLTCTSGTPKLVPLLETLKIDLPSLGREEMNLVIPMIASRTTKRPMSVRMLQQLTLYLDQCQTVWGLVPHGVEAINNAYGIQLILEAEHIAKTFMKELQVAFRDSFGYCMRAN